MEAIFDRIGRLELVTKLAVLLGVLAVMGVGYFFLFYKDLKDQRDRLEGAMAVEKKNKRTAEADYHNFVKVKRVVARLRKTDKRLARSLPEDADFPLGAIYKHAEGTGVQLVSVDRKDEEQTSVYARIPIALSIRGAYHKVMEFFWKLGQMDRIMKISHVKITDPKQKEGQVFVTVACEASTYRYLSRRRRSRRKTKGK
jgi:type IV pilus assembly protein PilO